MHLDYSTGLFNKIAKENVLININDTKLEQCMSDTAMHIRRYMQNELVRRCRANSSYSLRAFARNLQMDPSTLSQFLRHKRQLSSEQQTVLCEKLGLKLSFEENAEDSYGLPLDMFELIADWYHYAIFELVTLTDFREDHKWISVRLGISGTEAESAIARLERLDILVRDHKGRLRQGPEMISTTKNEFTASAFRLMQAQLLELAKKSMTDVPIEFRDQSSMTMAIDDQDLVFVKKQIQVFRRKLCRDLQKRRKRNSVYQLLISFFPLTKNNNEALK